MQALPRRCTASPRPGRWPSACWWRSAFAGLAARLVRGARRLAERLRAEWIVGLRRARRAGGLPREGARPRSGRPLRLAEQLGAETVGPLRRPPGRGAPAATRAAGTSRRSSSASRPTRAGASSLFGSVRDELERASERASTSTSSPARPRGRGRRSSRAPLPAEPPGARYLLAAVARPPSRPASGPCSSRARADQPGHGLPARRWWASRCAAAAARRSWPRCSAWRRSTSSSSRPTSPSRSRTRST